MNQLKLQLLPALRQREKKQSLKKIMIEFFTNNTSAYTEYELYDILKSKEIYRMPSSISRTCRKMAELGYIVDNKKYYLQRRIRDNTNYVEFYTI